MHVWSPIWQISLPTLAFYRCANKLREEGLPSQGHTANLMVMFENSLRQPLGLAQRKASWILLRISHCHLSRASCRFQVASQFGKRERLDIPNHCLWREELCLKSCQTLRSEKKGQSAPTSVCTQFPICIRKWEHTLTPYVFLVWKSYWMLFLGPEENRPSLPQLQSRFLIWGPLVSKGSTERKGVGVGLRSY